MFNDVNKKALLVVLNQDNIQEKRFVCSYVHALIITSINVSHRLLQVSTYRIGYETLFHVCLHAV